jgi:23S rRNA A1618 N6-methylase RlmF
MLATDIDPYSLSFARLNVSRNGLEESIEVVEVKEEGSIFPEGVMERASTYVLSLSNSFRS